MISFVGAGPGADDLLTLRAVDRLSSADVIVWASSLVSEAVLRHAPPAAKVYDSATMTLEDVLAVYASTPSSSRIIRLHSGDPSVYGAIHEQILWCIENERAFEIVPGVTSLSAAAAVLGCELTVPRISQSIVISRLPGRTAVSMPERETIASFASHGTTLAVFLSGARPKELQQALLAEGSGYDPSTPVAIVTRATWPDEVVTRTTLGEMASTMRSRHSKLTTLVLIGPALAAPGRAEGAEATRSHLYSPSFAHRFRRRSKPGTTAGVPSRHAATK